MRTNSKDDIFMQRQLLIDKAHTALDIFRFAHMVLIYMLVFLLKEFLHGYLAVVWLLVLGDALENPWLKVGKGVTLVPNGLSMHHIIIIDVANTIEEDKVSRTRRGWAWQATEENFWNTE